MTKRAVFDGRTLQSLLNVQYAQQFRGLIFRLYSTFNRDICKILKTVCLIETYTQMLFDEKIETYTLDGDCTFDEFETLPLAKTVYFVQTVSPLYPFFLLTQISEGD